jgi:histidinol-phosphate aminotransferase
MPALLKADHEVELIRRGFTRRNFGRIASLITAGAALPFYNEPALAQLSRVRNIPDDAVVINANENPLGPCADAMEAIHKVVASGGRYKYDLTDQLQETLAEQEGVKNSYVLAYPGSSAPLHQAVLAYCTKDRPFVAADPGYEAGGRAASFIGAKTVTVPLRKGTWDHDVKAMLAAAPNGGLFYICNPNNPTGTLTKKEDIEWLVANKPAGSIVLVDEAYIHISPSAVKCVDLVAQDKDVLVLRTFSKLYGMAGLRAGAAIAKPEILEKVKGWSAGMLPITGMVGATASLKNKNLVPERRKLMGDVREETFAFLTKKNVEFIPSESNCFMLNAKRPGHEFTTEMTKEKVYIGRTWKVWPTWVRVTIGTHDEMQKFQQAFEKVYA